MRRRFVRPIVCGAMLSPLLTLVPLDLTMANPTPHPVAGGQTEAALVEVTRPEAAAAAPLPEADAARARRKAAEDSAGTLQLPATGVKVLRATAPVATTMTLAAVAVTWTAGTASDTVVQIRTLRDGTWGAWENVEVDPSVGPDPGRGKGGRTPVRQGSELVMVSGATQVQGRILGAGRAPADAKMLVIDPGASDADAAVGKPRSGAAHAVVARPQIYTRSQWGADESWRTGTPESNTPRGIVIHHTADTNNYTADQVPGMLRAMYRYATQSLGWDDIAYNFIIDRWGRIWQGRAWLYPDQPVWPAATLSNNDRTIGVSMLGNYDEEVLSSAARSSLDRLMAWEVGLRGINPTGSMQLFNNKTNSYQTMPTITGHRDTYSTACPGGNLYPLIPGLRTEVAALAAGSGGSGGPTPPAVFRDFDGMGDADILGRDGQGRLTLSSPTGQGGMTAMELIGGPGWDAFDVVTVAGDWNGDGTPDVIARKSSTQELWLYPGNGRGQFLAPTRIGTGWGAFRLLVAPGDWNGDGKPDLLGISSYDHGLYLYPGSGKGGFSAGGTRIGTGWGAIRSIAGIGAWNGDGKPALATVTNAGTGGVYVGSGTGGFSAVIGQPTSWSSYRTLTGISNATGDGKQGVLGVDGAGIAWLGTRAGDGSVAWKRSGSSYAGYVVYPG